MFTKSAHPTFAALQTVGGILLASLLTYCALRAPEIIRGEHVMDWPLIRLLSLVGLLTLVVSAVENRVVA
jgi:hypothetical protein